MKFKSFNQRLETKKNQKNVFVVSEDTEMPPRTSNKVKVYLRTRPTTNFAAEMISIGRDNRVCSILKISV